MSCTSIRLAATQLMPPVKEHVAAIFSILSNAENPLCAHLFRLVWFWGWNEFLEVEFLGQRIWKTKEMSMPLRVDVAWPSGFRIGPGMGSRGGCGGWKWQISRRVVLNKINSWAEHSRTHTHSKPIQLYTCTFCIPTVPRERCFKKQRLQPWPKQDTGGKCHHIASTTWNIKQ